MSHHDQKKLASIKCSIDLLFVQIPIIVGVADFYFALF